MFVINKVPLDPHSVSHGMVNERLTVLNKNFLVQFTHNLMEQSAKNFPLLDQFDKKDSSIVAFAINRREELALFMRNRQAQSLQINRRYLLQTSLASHRAYPDAFSFEFQACNRHLDTDYRNFAHHRKGNSYLSDGKNRQSNHQID